MILTCPSCETQYFADDSTIGESGRTVKCAACDHSWFVHPDGTDDTTAPAGPAAHELYREKVREQRRRKSRFAALMSWLVTAGLFFALGLAAIIFRNDVVKVWPEAGAAYKKASFNVNRFGLEFDDIQRSRTFNDTIPIVTVTGNAINVARTTVDTPAVRVDLIDDGDTIVATQHGLIMPATLEAGAAGTFRVVLEQAPMESYKVQLTFVERTEMPAPPPEPEMPTASDEPVDELSEDASATEDAAQ